MKRIFAVVWTPGQYEILPTKKACRERMREWRERFEEAGWKVVSHAAVPSHVAIDPKTDKARAAIVLHEYDAETKERIVKLPPLKPYAKPDPKPSKETKRPRKGRKPVGA